MPAPQADFWIEDCTDRPDPDSHTDHEGIPWQASQMWHPTGPHPPPAVHIAYTITAPTEEEPPF